MEYAPSVVVKKGGFLSSLARGFFGLLTATVICVAGIGVYALHVVDGRLDQVLNMGEGVLASVTGLGGDALKNAKSLREALPPVFSDALNDRRAVDYRDAVTVDVRLADAESRHDGRKRAVVRVSNNGSETISLLALNIVLEDARGLPVRDFCTYVATPIAIDCDEDIRGPLLPGSTRTFSKWIRDGAETNAVSFEVSDMRVFLSGDAASGAAQVASASVE